MKSQNILLICLSMTLCLFIFIVAGCSDDSNSPTSLAQQTGPVIDIRGITQTAADETVISTDSDDWCFSTKNKNEIPSAFALHPAYPNPSYQQVMLRFDLPIMENVNLSIVDSNGTVIRNILDGVIPAGEYTTSWDRKNNSGQSIDSGLFRLMMTAGDFECYGDIQLQTILNDLNPVLFTTSVSGNAMTVKYNSEIDMGGLFIILAYTGQIINIDYDGVADDMLKLSINTGQTERILFAPGLSESKSLPVLPEGNRTLCTIYFDGSISLAYADASDATGLSVIRTDIANQTK